MALSPLTPQPTDRRPAKKISPGVAGGQPKATRLGQSNRKIKLPSWGQFKYLNDLLSKRETFIFRLCLLLIILSGTVLCYNFYHRHIDYRPQAGGTYTEGLVGMPNHINPLYSSINEVDLDLEQIVYSGLVKYQNNQELTGDLAESWEISADQKTYTFKLRPNVQWQDGEDFKAEDVIFTIQAIQANEYKSPRALSFSGVTVEQIDNLTVKLTLPEPFTPFIASLTLGILPAHLWSDIPPNNAPLADLNLKPIGTGPYKFKKLVKDKNGFVHSYTLTRNDNYYGQKPYIDELTFKFYPDFITAIDALKKKNVDGLSFVPKENRQELKVNKAIGFKTLHLPQYTALFINQNKNPFLRDASVRQALAYALDREAIINQVLDGEGEVINTPILPGFIGYNPLVQRYDYDPVKAKKTLDDGGYALLAGEKIYQKKGQELAVTLTTVDQPENKAAANLIKDYWQAIGIKVNLNLISKNDIAKTIIKPREYEILLYGEIVGNDPDPYPFWHSSQNRDPGLNLAVFSDKKVDQLLEEARQTSDPEQRRIKYLHFQNILTEELPAIFLYNPTYTYPLAKKIKGFPLVQISAPSDRFNGIETWYINTYRRWK